MNGLCAPISDAICRALESLNHRVLVFERDLQVGPFSLAESEGHVGGAGESDSVVGRDQKKRLLTGEQAHPDNFSPFKRSGGHPIE
jgi:hypothetical protein